MALQRNHLAVSGGFISSGPNSRPAMTAGWRCPAGGGGVDRGGALGGEAVQVARAAGLGAGAGEPFATKWLHPDDGADHVAVDIGVADGQPGEDVAHGLVDPAVDP